MKLETQVCSLELAKKLKELGVKQESYFWWAEEKTQYHDWKWDVHDDLYEGDYNKFRNEISAFTVAELGEMLPKEIDSIKGRLECSWDFRNNLAMCSYYNYETTKYCFTGTSEETEADARAKMLVYLLENNFIK